MTGSVAGVLRNLGLFAISLVLAVVVWVVAVNEDNPLEERIVPRAIPVEVTGLQANVMVLGGLATEATVTLRAPRLTWPTLAINKLRVVADVTQWQSGSQVVTLRGVFPDQQAEVVVIEPPVVTLQLARVVTRTLPVRVRIIGDPAIGYTFGSPVLSVVDAAISGGYVSTLAIHPSMYAKLSYDPAKDFVGISQVATTSLVMVVPPSLKVNSLQEFVALAKSKPGQLSYASVGNGSGAHLSAEMLKLMAGINIVQVPYKGSGPALTDLVGGHVQVMFDALPSSVPLVAAGKLKALAVTSAARSSAAPDIPTVAESGFPGYDIAPWFGVLVPSGTPAEIVSRLNSELVKILAQPDTKARLSGLGADPVSDTPEQFNAFMRAETIKWDKLVKAANIKPD